jgi:SAM-dependent methyltransferase
VLDVGCGRATFLRRLRKNTRGPRVGLDPSDAGWDEADPEDDRLRLVRGSFPEAERPVAKALAPAGGFAVITLWHALEHDYRPLETLRILRRLAHPGALLVVEVPDLSSWSARMEGPSWAGLHTPRHTAAYTPSTLRMMLEAGGWRVESLSRSGTLDPWVLWWLGRQARRGDSLSGPLERRFPGFVAGKALTLPVTLARRWIPLGIQLALARAPR